MESRDYQNDFYDPESSPQPRDRGRELNLEAIDLDERCEKGEWGTVKPLIDIHITTVIKGPGCQPITPFIMMAITLTVWFFLSKILWTSVEYNKILGLVVLAFGGLGLSISLFWTAFTDPGFITRRHEPNLASRMNDALYC